MLLPISGAAAQTSSTVVYDQEFFAQFPNAVSAADLIRRIPGGRRILDSRGGDARGFSRNDDRILINGKRMSGKGNDSRSALDRITVDQVERIELIRGSSPDIKVSSQEAILNIITRGTLSKGSGSWQAEARITRDGRVQPGGFLSYGGTLGKLDYFASVKFEPENNITDRIEDIFDGAGQLTKRIIESRKESRNDGTASLNLSYNFENGNQLKLNGQFSEDGETFNQPGRFFEPDALGTLIEAGQAFRLEKLSRPRWEIGGDFEASLSDRFRLKILGLYSRTDETFRQGEDFEITGGSIEDDVLSIEDKLSTEAIGRASLIWSIKPGSELEFGSEFSLNKLTSGLAVFERVSGILEQQNVAASDTIVKETRNESFLIYTTKLSAKLSLEASLFTEYSKIEQSGDAQNSRTF
ncbi:MAG: TonB-dependent receptor plug domain-containing protein, partial [Sphingomonadales bacterium]